MHLLVLRDLQIRPLRAAIILEYRCKMCNDWVKVTLLNEEYLELKNGVPFRQIFGTGLQHLRKGICEQCLAQNFP